MFRVDGDQADKTFENEPGGHRWQRVPPTEKRGRVHTSTVTVAVLLEPTETQVVLHDSELEWSYCRSSGHGGQHLQKTDSAVQLKHKPSGLMVRCESERSQPQNKRMALALLRAKLWELKNQQESSARSSERKQQVGCGARGDKRRTIRTQDGYVHDHITGRRWRYKEYVRGEW